MRRLLLAAPLLLLVSLGLAQEETEPDRAEARLRLEVDPHNLGREVARIDSLIEMSRAEDAIEQLQKLAQDARARDGLFPTERDRRWQDRTLVSFDRLVLERLRRLEHYTKALDARFDDEAARLEDAGRSDPGALATLVERFPFSARAPGAAIALAERDLEDGRPDAAAARAEEMLRTASRATPAQGERARVLRALALALAGRDAEADQALETMKADAKVKALVAGARAERKASERAAPTAPLPEVAWRHEVADYYEPPSSVATAPTLVEPTTDGDRVYVQDGKHALALEADTGKVAWRSALPPREEGFRHPDSPCRIALGPTAVACVVPAGLVVLDRATGDVLYRVTSVELRKLAKIDDEVRVISAAVVAGGTIVVPLEASHADDELYLLGIDARTGGLLWRVFLVGETADPGAPEPTLAEGADAVYCLTNRGVIAALEPRTGSIRWLRRYASARDTMSAEPAPRFGRGGRIPRVVEGPEARRGFVGLVEGKVLAAPSDAHSVFAWEPRTGALEWCSDDEGARVIAPYGDGLLEIKKDGAIVSAGRAVEKILDYESANVVGEGVLVGSTLFLPLDGGIVRVDLRAKTALLACSWAPLHGRPANLACARGSLIATSTARTVALASAARAPGAEPADARSACRALAAPSFSDREAAQAKLIALGDAARAELEHAALSADPEVRIRARDILDAIARRERYAAWRPRIKEEWLAGENAGLLDRLTHPNAEVRLEAVRDLGNVKDDAVQSLLLELLKDSDERVDGSAAIALLRRGDRTGIAAVGKLLESAALEDRVAAAKALAEKGLADDFALLAKAASDDDGEVRGIAVTAALRVAPERALPLALKLATDKDDKVRHDFVAALVPMRVPADVSAPIFAKFVSDAQPGIRELVLEQLWTVAFRHRKEALDAFATALADPVEKLAKLVRLRVVNLPDEDLRRLPSAGVEKLLDDPSIQEQDRFHYVQVAEAIIEGGGTFSAATLAKAALDTKDPRVSDRAVGVVYLRVQLEAPLTPADIVAITSLTLAKPVTPDEDGARNAVFLRKAGYMALSRAHAPGVGRALLNGLADPDPEVRELVRAKLPEAEDADVLVELLHREASAPSPEEQAAAAALLDGNGNVVREALAPVLVAALDDKDGRVRACAWRRVRALAETDEDLGLFDPEASPEERAASVRRAASWLWRKKHKAPSVYLESLAASNAAERWRAAHKLSELATPAFRALVTPELLDAVLQRAAAEREIYVLREELAAFAALSGKPCTFADGATPEERARALKVALDWRK